MTALEKKQMAFAEMVAELIDQALVLGFQVTLGEAWRSDETAKLDAKEGKGIANSLHRIRLAIDLNLWKDGVLLKNTPDYAPLGEWWESQSVDEYSCAWGGRFMDGNHFSFAHEGVK